MQNAHLQVSAFGMYNMTNKVRLDGLRPGYMVDSKRQTAPVKCQSMSRAIYMSMAIIDTI